VLDFGGAGFKESDMGRTFFLSGGGLTFYTEIPIMITP
jgi:hypothetical protein